MLFECNLLSNFAPQLSVNKPNLDNSKDFEYRRALVQIK
jgi:hypothetical protein